MAISDDWTVDYANRRIYHSNGSTVYSVNELYSWLMNVFDEDTTIDDTIPMTAQTPTAYTLTNSWFLDYINSSSHQFLDGGSIKTSGWDATASAGGIRVLTFNSSGYSDPDLADIGTTVDYAGGNPADTGILLAFDSSSRKWWVRVQSTSATYFSNTGTQVRANGTNRGTLASTSTTGENIWTNIYTLGTIRNNTQIYLYQDNNRITPWWDIGHIDILVLAKEAGTLIDSGLITFFTRQYTTLYDHYQADLSSGNQTPIPLATFDDLNNSAGYRTFIGSSGSGTFVVGDVIQKVGDSSVQGIVTYVAGNVTDPVLTYYLFKSPFTDFADTDDVENTSQTATCTAGAPSNTGPAGYAGITITFGATSQNLNNNHGSRPYDVIIDCNDNSLANVYQYFKFITRYGSNTSLNGHNGEDYVAVGDIRLPYSDQVGSFSEGATVTGGTSQATGIIVADHDDGSDGALILRDVTGTFVAGETITQSGGNTATAGTLEAISPNKQSPFGSFAGGKFFGARGVWLDTTSIQASDANNYELIDSEGVRQVPPTSIALTVNSVVAGDRVSVFKTTGDNETIDRNQFTSHAVNNIAGNNTFEVTTDIPSDTPIAGVVRVIDNSLSRETRYTYTGWSGRIFTGVSPVLDRTYEASDTAYVPYIDTTSSGSSVSKTITYDSDRFVLTAVRSAGIQPFKVKGQINSGGLTVTAIRNPDSVYQ